MAKRKELSVAQWVVQERGVRGLWHVIDLVLLWSMATGAGEADTHDAVRAYGERTKWGSQAKFYRELSYWRELMGTESPGPLVEGMLRRGGRAGEQGEVLGRLWKTPVSAVVSG